VQTVHQLLEAKGGRLFRVAPHESVLRAIEIMATNHVGALLVMQDESLLGIVSERDYARKVILMNRASRDTAVADIMSAPPITVAPEHTVHHCMELMTEKRIRHLPVLGDGRVLGILSIGDLVKAVIDEQSRRIEALEGYIAG
jgi:CBS domain-containing protein